MATEQRMAVNRPLDPPKLASISNLMNRIGGSAGEVAVVGFESRDRAMRAFIPTNQLWIAVKDILVYEGYEFLEQFRLRQLSSGVTVIDGGAFVGLYSLKASVYASRVVALEPSLSNCRYLDANIELNHSQNVEARRVALSSKSGSAFFFDANPGSASSLQNSGDYRVETISLDELIDDVGFVDLLKLDIEGSEYDALSTTRTALRRIDRIVGEVHVFNESQRQGLRHLGDLLVKAGFETRLLWSPFQSAGYGALKPWNCALKSYNQRGPVLYRLLLSALYGCGPFARVVGKYLGNASTALLFASSV